MYLHARRNVAAALVSLGLLLGTAGRMHAQTATPRHFTPRVRGGSCAKWDFVGTDVPGRRFYVPCGDHVAVFDLDRVAAVGTITGFTEASAIVVASKLHRAFVNDGGRLTVFDTKTHRVIRSITGAGGDGIAYDPVTQRVFPFGDTVHVIDARTLRSVGTVQLGRSKPESGAADGAGRIFVALAGADAIAVIDARTLALSRWDVAKSCHAPKTVAFDSAYQRVLVGCAAANTLASIDARSGVVTANAQLGGEGMDQTGYDPTLHLLVNPTWDHVITLVRLAPDGGLTVVDTVRTTEPTHRNVGVDPFTHRAIFAVADYAHPTDGPVITTANGSKVKLLPGHIELMQTPDGKQYKIFGSDEGAPESFGIITLPLGG